MALLTNWVWLVGKSDFKIMFPRELFLFSSLSSNKDYFFHLGKQSCFEWDISSHKASVAWGLQNVQFTNGAAQR